MESLFCGGGVGPDIVQVGNVGCFVTLSLTFPLHFAYQIAFMEEHHMSLMLDSFFLQVKQEFTILAANASPVDTFSTTELLPGDSYPCKSLQMHLNQDA